MTVRLSGTVELGNGWRLTLPNECLSDREPDGSWSAWDSTHRIDVQIVTVGSGPDGRPADPATVLGRAPTARGDGWVGHVDEVADDDERGPVFRTAIAAAGEHTLLSCRIAYRDTAHGGWADQVWQTIAHHPATDSR